MRFLIAPDSFKGSLTAKEAAFTMRRAVLAEMPEAIVDLVPMADGGEGTVDAIVEATGGTIIEANVRGPLGRPVSSRYGVIADNGTEVAVIEVANICGLTMVEQRLRNPYKTTSYGVGEMIKIALDRGCRSFIIGLGGSATNDGGMGMLTALGARFTDRDGNPLSGYGKDLLAAAHADFSGLDARLRECRITIAGDVTNPLTGPAGASRVFGPQKGATPKQVEELDRGMVQYAALLEPSPSERLSERPGAGAAGGLGFALMKLGAAMESGAEIVARMTGIKKWIQQADLVLTGEGGSDDQTVFGKLPWRVAEWAKGLGKPTILISGSVDAGSTMLLDSFAACFSIVNRPATLEACMDEAVKNLEFCTRNVVRALSLKKSR